MVDGHKVKALDISLENGILRAFYGYYIVCIRMTQYRCSDRKIFTHYIH